MNHRRKKYNNNLFPTKLNVEYRYFICLQNISFLSKKCIMTSKEWRQIRVEKLYQRNFTLQLRYKIQQLYTYVHVSSSGKSYSTQCVFVRTKANIFSDYRVSTDIPTNTRPTKTGFHTEFRFELRLVKTYVVFAPSHKWIY